MAQELLYTYPRVGSLNYKCSILSTSIYPKLSLLLSVCNVTGRILKSVQMHMC